MEIDISEKVSRATKYAVACVVLLTLVCSAGVWWWQKNSTYLILRNASVSGDLVNTRVKASGTLVEFLVNDGDAVVQGDVVARLQIRISPEQIKQLESAAEQAAARYQELLANPRDSASSSTDGIESGAAREELDRAAKHKERMDSLFAIGGISKVQQRQAEDAYRAALGAYQAVQSAGRSVDEGAENYMQLTKIAEFQMRQAQLALEASRQTLQASDVVAPVGGIVHFLEVKAGDSVEAGQVVMQIGDVENLWLQAVLSPAQARKIKLGQFAEYVISDYQGQSFQGTVYEISDSFSVDEVGNPIDQGVHARISLPADSGVEMKPGMQAKIKVSL